MAVKGIGKLGLIGYIRELLKQRLHPALFHILEPMLDALGKIENDIYSLLDTKLPTSASGLLEFSVTIIKKVLKLAWDSLSELAKAIWEMANRAWEAARDFAQYLVDTGRIGVTRSIRYVGSETLDLAHYFLMADHYKIYFAGMAEEKEDDSVWPSADKAIGFALWHVLDALAVKPTSKRIAEDVDEPYDDYWVSTIQRDARWGAGIAPHAPAAVRHAAAEDGHPMQSSM